MRTHTPRIQRRAARTGPFFQPKPGFQPSGGVQELGNDVMAPLATEGIGGNTFQPQSGLGQGQNQEEGAIPTPAVAPAATPAPLLNAEQLRRATIFMRNTYSPQSLALLRSHFGLSAGSRIDRDLLLAVAQYQNSKGGSLVVDGMLGENSFNALQAETGEATRDLVMFTIESPSSGGMRKASSGGLTDMLGHFTVEIHLPPGQDCSQYEYRQFICARVEMLPATARADGAMTVLSSLFSVPGGLQAIPNFTEDGSTVLGSRYGRRSLPARPENHYLDADGNEDQANGCIFRSWDFPGLRDRVTRPGELYEFDFRFMGIVRHRERGIIARQFWSIREDFTI